MGVNVHIDGYKAPTEEYHRKAAAWRACDDAGVEPPEELKEYFDWGCPSNDGMPVDLKDCIEGEVEYGDGALIDLSKLPEGTTHIRVDMR